RVARPCAAGRVTATIPLTVFSRRVRVPEQAALAPRPGEPADTGHKPDRARRLEIRGAPTTTPTVGHRGHRPRRVGREAPSDETKKRSRRRKEVSFRATGSPVALGEYGRGCRCAPLRTGTPHDTGGDRTRSTRSSPPRRPPEWAPALRDGRTAPWSAGEPYDRKALTDAQ